MKAPFLQETSSGVRLSVHLQPNATKNEICGVHGSALKVRLRSPPVDGKANAHLIDFIAERLGICAAQVRLVRGQTSRHKILDITEMDAATAHTLLSAPLS